MSPYRILPSIFFYKLELPVLYIDDIVYTACLCLDVLGNIMEVGHERRKHLISSIEMENKMFSTLQRLSR